MTGKTACIYARLATTQQQGDAAALPQLQEVREFAAQQGWSIVAEYVDVNASGLTDQRPGLRSMMAQARKTPKRFDRVLVLRLSRLFRDPVLLERYKRELGDHGVRIVSIDEPDGE